MIYAKYNLSIEKAVISERAKKLKIGYCKVNIAGIDEEDMYIVVLKGLSHKPIILPNYTSY